MLPKKNLFCLFLSLLMLVTLFTPATAEEVKYTSDTIQVTIAYDKTLITVSNLSEDFVGKTVVCCWYLDEVLQDARLGIYQSGGISITAEVPAYDAIKCFLWEDTVSFNPLSGGTSIPADNWVDTSTEVVTLYPDDFIGISAQGVLQFYNSEGKSYNYYLSPTAEIIYNGTSLSNTSITPSNIFGTASNGHLISTTASSNGMIRMMDDSGSGYKKVELEVGIPAVVKSIDTDGNLVFKNTPAIPYYYGGSFARRMLARLNLTTDVTSLIQNGVTCAPSQVKAGDVLILKPNYDASSYKVELLGGSSCIGGTVQATNASGKVLLPDGNWYPVARDGYCVNGLEAGDTGSFYLYCGKIVCFTESYTPANYGYVMRAVSFETTDNGFSVAMMMLNTDNKIYEVSLADSFTLQNLNYHDSALSTALSGSSYTDSLSMKTDMLTLANATALAKVMTNKLVSYDTNADGEIITITFPQNYDNENVMYQAGVLNSASNASFNQSNLRIGNIYLEETTLVFLIDDENTITYGDSATNAFAGSSGVTTATELADGASYDYVAFDNGNDIAGAVVIMNVAAKTPAEFAENQLTTPVITNHYGYIINTMADEGIWGDMTVIAQILDQSGEVYEAALADSVTLKNLDAHNVTLATTLAGTANISDFTLNLTSLNRALANDLANALKNKIVTYSGDTDGNISSVTLPQTMDSSKPMYQAGTLNAAATADYNDGTHMIDNIEITQDTKVFHISNMFDTVVYGSSSNLADIDYCRTADGNDLQSNTYQYLAFDNGKALVVMNNYAKISPSSNVAVIQSVSPAVNQAGTRCYLVEYYIDGELKTATTHPDLYSISYNAGEGDVYQLLIANGEILSAVQLLDFNRASTGVVSTTSSIGVNSTQTGTVFGAVYNISKRGNLFLRWNGTQGNISASDGETANVYVVDPNKKDGYQISLGTIYSAYVDENLTTFGNKIDLNRDNVADIVVDGASEDRLLDYAFAYQYQGDAIDIVIYKAYDFALGYSLVY